MQISYQLYFRHFPNPYNIKGCQEFVDFPTLLRGPSGSKRLVPGFSNLDRRLPPAAPRGCGAGRAARAFVILGSVENVRPDPVSAVAENVTFILVETQNPGNIGAAARALQNMGLRRLKLVRPRRPINDECLAMAGKAADLVLQGEVAGSLEEAVAGEHLLVGTTSSRDRRIKQKVYSPREVAPLVWKHARHQRVGILFGSERRGLTNRQLARCQYLVSIPSNPEYPVLNLAQAVLILAYEIYLAQGVGPASGLPLVSQKEREEMFAHMQRVLVEIGFLSRSNPEHIMDDIRRFLARADLTPRDVRILRGMMSQVDWYVRQGRFLPPEKIKKP